MHIISHITAQIYQVHYSKRDMINVTYQCECDEIIANALFTRLE